MTHNYSVVLVDDDQICAMPYVHVLSGRNKSIKIDHRKPNQLIDIT